MRESPGPVLEVAESPLPELRLLVAPDPWLGNFFQNVRDLFVRREAPMHLQSAPAVFWPDVFVERKLPWRRFFESGSYHLLALVAIWAGSRFFTMQPQITAQPAFTRADVVYYTPSEYLPPLDTRRSPLGRARRADPEVSVQPIISVPPEADNHSQTIVAAPRVQLPHDVQLPNTVAWSDKPRMPVAPAPVMLAAEISRLAPQMDHSVIAPPPAFEDTTSQKALHAPQPAVIAPPPAVESGSSRRLGDMNIGHSTVIAPAPQLSLDEQRAISAGRYVALREGAAEVIAPPPSVGASGGSPSGRDIIALSLHPVVGAPSAPPTGNRRGTFAATPGGHSGASGRPGRSTGDSGPNASEPGAKSTNGLPSGLFVGRTSNATSTVAGDPAPKSESRNSVNPNLIAGMRMPRVSRTPRPGSEGGISEAERAVFGSRKIYSLSLNMPNLNSAGGSWIIRFAARTADSTPANPSGENTGGDLSSPAAVRKVDPAYPLQLMRQNVGGTVILYGVIRADGTVANVRVLRSVDDRLDQFASEALVKWQFRPATKNGTPVDVEATFWIPFRPTHVGSSF